MSSMQAALMGFGVKGSRVSFRGMLSAAGSGRGVCGVKIKIFEQDGSIFGDDCLAFGRTGVGGSFILVGGLGL